jgi:hypothetical protein
VAHLARLRRGTRWAAHDVRLHRSGIKQFRHPGIGDLDPHFATPRRAGHGPALLGGEVAAAAARAFHRGGDCPARQATQFVIGERNGAVPQPGAGDPQLPGRGVDGRRAGVIADEEAVHGHQVALLRHGGPHPAPVVGGLVQHVVHRGSAVAVTGLDRLEHDKPMGFVGKMKGVLSTRPGRIYS